VANKAFLCKQSVNRFVCFSDADNALFNTVANNFSHIRYIHTFPKMGVAAK